MAFDVDVDDTVSESHCNDGTNYTAAAGAGQTMSFDYIGVPSVLDSCSGCCSWDDTRRDGCSAVAAVRAAAAAAESGSCPPGSDSESDFALDLVSATPVVLQSWNCFVFRLIPVAVLG